MPSVLWGPLSQKKLREFAHVPSVDRSTHTSRFWQSLVLRGEQPGRTPTGSLRLCNFCGSGSLPKNHSNSTWIQAGCVFLPPRLDISYHLLELYRLNLFSSSKRGSDDVSHSWDLEDSEPFCFGLLKTKVLLGLLDENNRVAFLRSVSTKFSGRTHCMVIQYRHEWTERGDIPASSVHQPSQVTAKH